MSIEDQANRVRNMLLAEMEKSKNIVFDGLLNNSVLNNIPESLFVNYFLPCFLGRSNNPNWTMEWISIAGSPMAEVGVFKDNTTEILYVVPSLLNTNNLYLHKQDGDIGDILTRYDQINANMPVRGLNFLIEALNSKTAELASRINFTDVNNKWINIFQRYGIVTQNPVTQATQQDSGDYFE